MSEGRTKVPRCEKMTDSNRVIDYNMGKGRRNGQRKAGKQEKKFELSFLTKIKK